MNHNKISHRAFIFSPRFILRSYQHYLVILAMGLLFLSAAAHADTYKIGLRAHIGLEKSMQKWKETAEYLSEKIPEHRFEMVPVVSLEGLLKEAGNNKFDFVITNPSSYVEMELRFGATALLTLRNKRQGNPYTKFGSVIFTNKDNKNINSIYDLSGKTIVAVSEPAFGGWRVAQREMLRKGFDPYSQAKKIKFSGGVQQNVVEIVRLGNADVGVVRTDMLERMAASGTIKLDDFKIINELETPGFPFYHSSTLYPEWAFVKMHDTSSELAKRVTLALLTMPANHEAAVSGKYVGWGISEDYQPVHNLMKELKLGPYQHLHDDSFEHFFEEHLYEVILFIVGAALILSILIYISTVNKKLQLAQSEQKRTLRELEQRVRQRTEDLSAAKELAEKANNAKTEFLAKMSHELRTPLNAVLGFAQLIEMESKEHDEALINDNAREILAAARHLLELISEVLELSKIESDNFALDVKPTAIGPVITEVTHLLDILSKEKNVALEIEFNNNEELEVLADFRALKQVLINIISNGLKYNHDGGALIISIEQDSSDCCLVNIKDTGDGMSQQKLDSIFDPFQRITNRKDVEGTGIGLTITKDLIVKMGGKINVTSQPEQGSVFSVCLKIAAD